MKLLPPKKIFSMTSTILIGQWPNLLTFRGGYHASATPLESDKMATRAKKAKTKSRYRNKFKTEWSAEFPGIASSKGNTEKARYVYCGTDFGIGHGGRSYVKRHATMLQSSRKMRVMTSRVGNLYLSWPKLFNTFSHILTSLFVHKCIHSFSTCKHYAY